MKRLAIFALAIALAGCVSGAPRLTAEQQVKLRSIEVYAAGKKPNKEVVVVSKVSAADCSGPGGSRLYGDEREAMDILLAKAASFDADALTDVSCGAAPFVNNCWAAKKCDGLAVKYKD